jgi:hypothetical protein
LQLILPESAEHRFTRERGELQQSRFRDSHRELRYLFSSPPSPLADTRESLVQEVAWLDNEVHALGFDGIHPPSIPASSMTFTEPWSVFHTAFERHNGWERDIEASGLDSFEPESEVESDSRSEMMLDTEPETGELEADNETEG